jgi:hypothetical protein
MNKNNKIKEIMNSGFYPMFRILKVCRSKKDLATAETILIRSLSKELYLLNVVNNRGRRITSSISEAKRNTQENISLFS